MRAALVAALALVFVGSVEANAQPNDDRLEAAVALYSAGDFANAAVIFESLYNDTKLPDALFGWAQALRQDGQCPEALKLYRQYLAETNPQPHQVDAANEAIALCPKEPVIEPLSEPDEKASVAATVTDPVFSSEVPSDAERRSPDWVSLGLIGFSAVAAATSGTFYLLARSAESDADGAATHDDFAAFADSAESRQRSSQIAGVATFAGVAALVVWKLTRRDSREPTVTAGPTLSEPGAFVRVRF